MSEIKVYRTNEIGVITEKIPTVFTLFINCILHKQHY